MIGRDILEFFSEIAEQNSMKLDRKQISTSSTKFVFFGAIRETRWPPCPLIGWDIFDFLLWNYWTELNETWQELRSQRPFTKFVFFQADPKKTRWPPWPMICRDILEFFSEIAKQNSMKLDKKQDLNVLYQVCVFRGDQRNKMAALASDWLRHFRLLIWNRWKEFN